MNFFRWLLDGAAFRPRWSCGAWGPDLIGANIAANLAIALAYGWIAYAFVRFWLRIRHRVGGAWLVLAIAGFVGWCGVTHLDDVLVFWWPAYRLFTGIEAVTAALSAATAALVGPVLDYLVGLPSSAELEAARDALATALEVAHERAEEAERLRVDELNTNNFLREKLAILEGRLGSEINFSGRLTLLDEVRAMLAAIPETPPGPPPAPPAPEEGP